MKVRALTRREVLAATTASALASCRSEAHSGWIKSDDNPVLGAGLGPCFDVCLLRMLSHYRMWFSWRLHECVAWTDSRDGVHWSQPAIALERGSSQAWDARVNRPTVVHRPDGYHMWFTGQTETHSAIGYAMSKDGVSWRRVTNRPVLTPSVPWEHVAVMCPYVIWDQASGLYCMWYSGGTQGEPNAIGYATSPDGLSWTRNPSNPVLRPNPAISWERERVTGAQIIFCGDYYYAFYIGFHKVNRAAIGLARSKDGITNWQRHPANPIIAPSLLGWDRSSCYKPFAIYDRGTWMLWYNGRAGDREEIGLATHPGYDLGFPRSFEAQRRT